MTRKMGVRWHLREVMATRGMFSTTDLIAPLAERGVELSREQVYRLVTQQPERLNVYTLAALCDLLECGVGDLIEPVVERRQQRKAAGSPEERATQEGARGAAPGARADRRPDKPPRRERRLSRRRQSCARRSPAAPMEASEVRFVQSRASAASGPARRSSPASRRVNPAGARAALELAALTTNEARNMITAHLAAHPTALVDGDSGAPWRRRAADRRADRAAGVDGLVRPLLPGLRSSEASALSGAGRPGLQRAARSAVALRELCARCGKLSPRDARCRRRDGRRLLLRPSGASAARSAASTAAAARIAPGSGSAPTARSARTRAARRAGATRRSRARRASRGASHCATRSPAPVRGVRRADGRAGPQRPAAVRELLPAAGRDLRPVRAGARDRPPRRRRRPGPVRDLLDRPDRSRARTAGRSARAAASGAAGCCAARCAPVRPQTCAHCGRDRRPMAHWPEGPVCSTCYHRALSAKGTCPACGQTRRLMRYPGFERAGLPRLRRRCRSTTSAGGAAPRKRPTQRGLCARCVLHDRLTELLGDRAATRRVVARRAVRRASRGARRRRTCPAGSADSPRDPAARQIARGELPCSHETLDRLAPTGRPPA